MRMYAIMDSRIISRITTITTIITVGIMVSIITGSIITDSIIMRISLWFFISSNRCL